MQVTISTHNSGSRAMRMHNLRAERCVAHDQNITQDGCHETWVDEAPRDAYERIFGDAVKEYNEKMKQQNRPGRQVKDYYTKMEKSDKKHAVYELIIGVYGKDGTIPVQVAREIMREYVAGWKERNPNLELIGAYYHADERDADAHVHIDYVPVATGYARGMKKQNGMDRALQQQGFYAKNSRDTAQIQWQKSENLVLENLCKERGYDVIHPQRGMTWSHVEQDIYKMRAAKHELELERDQLQQQVMTLKQVKDVEHSSRFGKVQMQQDVFDGLARTAAQAEQALAEIEKIRKAQKKAEEIIKAAEDKAERIKSNANFDAQKEITTIRSESEKIKRDYQRIMDALDYYPDVKAAVLSRTNMQQRRKRFTHDRER